MVKKPFSIDFNVKGAISEFFDKSHLSEPFDVPAGCIVEKFQCSSGHPISINFLAILALTHFSSFLSNT